MITIKSNIPALNITVDGGGAKVANLTVTDPMQVNINAMLYPNVSVYQSGIGNIDGGIIM